MQRARAGAVSAAAVAAALVSGDRTAAAETRPAYGGAIVGGLLSEPVSLDPVTARSHAELTVVSLVFDALYRGVGRDAAGRLAAVPHLAAAMPAVSDDGRQARIPIRQGVAFHDGAPLTPDDVARSLRRLAASDSGWLLAAVDAIDVDGHDVVLTLRRPAPELVAALTAPAAAVTPQGARPRGAAVVGSGQFKLRRLDRSARRLVLVANNEHFAGRPYVNTLDLRWFEDPSAEAREYEAGNAHVSMGGAIAFAGHRPKYETRVADGPATLLVYVGFGAANAAVTGSREFRHALSLALARAAFASVGSGERVDPAVGPLPAALDGPAATASDARTQLDRARARLRAAARSAPRLEAALSRSGALSLELLIDRSRPHDREIAEKVLAALFRLGLSGKIAAVDARTFAARRARGACDLYIGQLVPPAASPELAMAAAFAAGGSDWARRQLAAGALDLARAQREFAGALPVLPLFHRAVRVHHRSNVRGVWLDDAARLGFGDLFLHGVAVRSR